MNIRASGAYGMLTDLLLLLASRSPQIAKFDREKAGECPSHLRFGYSN